MFVFDNVLTAGTVLVRQQIESQNWESSGHTDGWYIGSDGSASFFNVTLHGDLVSANYVAGTTGYKLTYLTGSAEFNALTARGTLIVGGPTGNRMELKTSGSAAEIDIYSGAVSETAPGKFIGGITGSGQLEAQIKSPTGPNGYVLAEVVSSTAALGGGFFLSTTAAPLTGRTVIGAVNIVDATMQTYLTAISNAASGEMALLTGDANGNHLRYSGQEIQAIAAGPAVAKLFANNAGGDVSLGNVASSVYIPGTADVSGSGFDGPLVIGNPTGANLALDSNEVMARNNGVAAALFLNNDGGLVGIGTGAASGNFQIGPTAGAHMNMNFNQLWALNGAAASGLFLNFSSAGTVQIGDGTAAGADILCTAMRPVKQNFAGPGGTIISTTFVSSTAIGGTWTNVPASGSVRIDFSGRMAIVSGASAQRAFMGIQIQAGSSAGAVVYATTDTESVEVGLAASVSGNAGIYTLGKSIVIPPGSLTPGATYFVVITNRVTANTTSVTVTNAQITVTPMP